MGVLLPGGVAAGAVLILQAVRSWRESKLSREESVLVRAQRLIREADARTAQAEQDEAYAEMVADYWRQRSADLEFLMRQSGITVPSLPTLPTKGRTRGATNTQTRARKKLVRQPVVEPEEIETE